jgi:hypothetical protein
LRVMAKDELAPAENHQQLAQELADFYKKDTFLKTHNMGQLLRESLRMLF